MPRDGDICFYSLIGRGACGTSTCSAGVMTRQPRFLFADWPGGLRNLDGNTYFLDARAIRLLFADWPGGLRNTLKTDCDTLRAFVSIR